MKKEHAGVVLVFGGFAVAVLVFRGVWGRAFHALTSGKDQTGTANKAAAASVTAGRPVVLQPGSFGLEYPTPASGATPGSAPRPATAPDRHPLISGASGDVAGRPGENVFHFTSADQNHLWAFHGGWAGPGTYQAEKFTDPSHGNTSGTELVRVGG